MYIKLGYFTCFMKDQQLFMMDVFFFILFFCVNVEVLNIFFSRNVSNIVALLSFN